MQGVAPEWVKSVNFYQIFPDRLKRGEGPQEGSSFQDWEEPPHPSAFKGGNLWGVIEDLDRIRDLGFTALYFTPIFASVANHRYHTHDYMSVDPVLGGNAAFDRLLSEAHKRGMKVVLDGVFNHTGRSFFAFAHIMENGLYSPYLDWYHINREFLREQGQLKAYPGEVQEKTFESFRDFGYRAWWDLPALPKLNTDHPQVRNFIYAVAEHWVCKGIDGWRLDVPREISTPGFWEGFRRRVKGINPGCYLVGEIWEESPDFLQGDRFDGLMNYPLGTSLMGFFFSEWNVKEAKRASYRERPRFHTARELVQRLQRNLEQSGKMGMGGQMNLFTSHDTPRLMTLCSGKLQEELMALACLFALPGSPCLFFGEEYGLEGNHDPDCRGTIPQNLRNCPPDLYQTIRALARFRQEHRALQSTTVEFLTDLDVAGVHERFFVMCRGDTAQACVCVNAGPSPVSLSRVKLPLPPQASLLSLQVVEESARVLSLGSDALIFPPQSVTFLV